ncbi:MAG TPA: hypothetical protein VF203_07850 [Burkholderiales bacterium]
MPRLNAAIRAAAIASALLFGGCSDRDTPQDQIRALIAAAEAAAEKREIGTLRGYVSDSYADEGGRDRRAIDAILRLYLLRHESIHLLTRISDVQFIPPAAASAVVYVAMSAVPVADAEALGRLRADFYRFEIDFAREDGDWRVRRAAWRPAELADFVYRPAEDGG